jgi:hypothetical protein
MKQKHTPGPWHITQSESNLADADGKIIPLPMRLTASYNAVGDNATRKANAKLIAAAPELLELLKQVQEKWIRPESHYWGSETNIAIEKLIEKIEGNG